MKNINTDDFKFSMPINIRWNDFDPLGHVNNIYYFEYFQIARGIYMNKVSPTWDWNKHMFVIAHIECDYFKEVGLKANKPIVKTRVLNLSKKSFEMEYLVTSTSKEGEEVLHAKGKSVNVMIDMVAKSSAEIPDWLRSDITTYEPAL